MKKKIILYIIVALIVGIIVGYFLGQVSTTGKAMQVTKGKLIEEHNIQDGEQLGKWGLPDGYDSAIMEWDDDGLLRIFEIQP